MQKVVPFFILFKLFDSKQYIKHTSIDVVRNYFPSEKLLIFIGIR